MFWLRLCSVRARRHCSRVAGADIHHVAGKTPVRFVDRGAAVERHQCDRDLESAQEGVAVERVDPLILAQDREAVCVDRRAGRRRYYEIGVACDQP